MAKKRHHYVPESYLHAFCDHKGMLTVYRTEEPDKELRMAANNAALQNYYYAQPMPDGGKDTDTLENVFSTAETPWPDIVSKCRQRTSVNHLVGEIYAFIALQRARVPATRDAIESALADHIKLTVNAMKHQGVLEPLPAKLKWIEKHIEVAIDPHQSLHAMVDIMRGVGDILNKVGIFVQHNQTTTPFLTSDNPVIWFDSSVSEADSRPYAVNQTGPISLLFPIAPDLILRGESESKSTFDQYGLCYADISDENEVTLINRSICKYAYEIVFSSRPGNTELVAEFADVVPTPQIETISASGSKHVMTTMTWGKKRKKPKWNQHRD